MSVTHREACPWQDVPELYHKIYSQRDSIKRRALLAIILCVPRINEFVALRVSEVNTEKRVITILKSKTSDEPWGIPYPTQMDSLFAFTAEWPFGGYASQTIVRDLLKRLAPDVTA